MKTGQTSDIATIGRRLAGYGTYLCNRRHDCPANHICSFLVCPGPRKPQSDKPELSISLSHQEDRRQRSVTLQGPLSFILQITCPRRRVRFCDSGEFKIADQILYPLEQELMEKMEKIKLDGSLTTENTNRDTAVETLSDTVSDMSITNSS